MKKNKNDLPEKFSTNNININTNSQFNINKNNAVAIKKDIKFNTRFKKEKLIKCQKVKMILNKEQKEILDKWFYAYTKMYNETLTYIRTNE